jgi:dienelactone hydrolase
MARLPFPDRHDATRAVAPAQALPVGDEVQPRALPAVGHATPRDAVRIPAGTAELDGELSLPPAPMGLVIFALDGASGRYCPRNRGMADVLHQRGIATLLVDLLTLQEDAVQSPRSDLDLLQARLDAVIGWAGTDGRVRKLPIGLYGTNTAAAATLRVAASGRVPVSAVVSRGGRPDQAGQPALLQVRSPVLLIIGGADSRVLEANRHARELMGSWASIREVPGAGHLFVEPGALGQVATMMAEFFDLQLRRR